MNNKFKEELKRQENGIKAGYDPKTKKWFPHASPEGGTDTIGYGTKLTQEEADSGLITINGEQVNWKNGLSNKQVNALFEQDVKTHEDIVRRDYPEYDNLPEKYKGTLVNIAFNTGSAKPSNWPSLYGHIKNSNDEGVIKESLTSFTDTEGVRQPLTSRRDAIAKSLGLGSYGTVEQSTQQAPVSNNDIFQQAISIAEDGTPSSIDKGITKQQSSWSAADMLSAAKAQIDDVFGGLNQTNSTNTNTTSVEDSANNLSNFGKTESPKEVSQDNQEVTPESTQEGSTDPESLGTEQEYKYEDVEGIFDAINFFTPNSQYKESNKELDNFQKALREEVNKSNSQGSVLGQEKQSDVANKAQEKQGQVSNNTKQQTIQETGKGKVLKMGGLSDEQVYLSELNEEDFLTARGVTSTSGRDYLVAKKEYQVIQAKKAKALKGTAYESKAIFEDTSTIGGALGNLGVAAGSSFLKFAGDVLSAPATAYQREKLTNVSQESIAMYNIVKEKIDAGVELNNVEQQFLNLKAFNSDESLYSAIEDSIKSERVINSLQRAGSRYDKYVNRESQQTANQITEDSYRQYEAGEIDAIELAAQTFAAYADNSSAIPTLIGDSAGTIAGIMLNAPATLWTMYESNSREITDEWVKNNNGKRPNQEETQEILAFSSLAAIADFYGDKLLGSSITGKVGLNKVVEKIGSKIGSSKLKSVGGSALNIIATGAGEAVAEGSSEKLKQVGAGSEDNAKVFGSAVAGAAAGKGTAVVGEGSKVVSAISEEGVKQLEAAKERTLAREAKEAKEKEARKAERKGEVVEEAPVEEAPVTVSEKVAKTIDSVSEAFDSAKVQKTYNEAIENNNVDTLPKEGDANYNAAQDYKARITVAQNKADSLYDEGKLEESKVEDDKYWDLVDGLEAQVTSNIEKIKSGQLTENEANKLSQENNELIQVRDQVFGTDAEAEVTANELANSDNEVYGSRGKVSQVIAASNKSPESISPEVLDSIATNSNLNLDSSQVEALTKASETAKSISQVRDDIKNGYTTKSGEFKPGLTHYIKDNTRFLETGNIEGANQSLANLKSWRQEQAVKLNQKTYIDPVTGREKLTTPTFLEAVNKDLADIDFTIANIENNIEAFNIPVEATQTVDTTPSVDSIAAPVEQTPEAIEEQEATEVVDELIVEDETDTTEEALASEAAVSGEVETTGISIEERVERGKVSTKEYKDNLKDLYKGLKKKAGATKETAELYLTSFVEKVQEGKTSQEILKEMKPLAKEHFKTKSNNAVKLTKELLRKTVEATYGTKSGRSLAKDLTSATKESITKAKEVAKEVKEIVSKGIDNTLLRAAHRKNDILRNYFTDGNRNNVLQTNEDFFSSAETIETKIATYMDRELTQAEKDSLNNFMTEFKPSMDSLFDNINYSKLQDIAAKYPDVNMTSLFLNEEGKFDDNVKDAVIIAMYKYIMTQANDSFLVNNERINEIIGLHQDVRTPDEARVIFETGGIAPFLFIESLGQDILNILNIDSKDNTYKNYETQMIGSFGIMATQMLEEAGFINKVEFTPQDNIIFKKLIKNSNEKDPRKHVELVATPAEVKALKDEDKLLSFNYRIATEMVASEDVLAPSVNAIVELSREVNKTSTSGTPNMWAELFDGLNFNNAPVLDKPTEIVDIVKGTNKKVPASTKKAIKEQQEVPHYFRLKEMEDFLAMDKEIALIMLGKKDPAKAHKRDVESIENKNVDIERSYDDMVLFYNMMQNNGGADQAFYFHIDIWKNGRVGYRETLFNPQSNKVHRGFTTVGSWIKTVDLNNEEHMKLFWRGMEETTGIESREDFENNKGGIKDAVDTVLKVREGLEVEASEMEALAAYVSGEANTETYTVLNEIAKVLEAEANGDTTFESSFAIEVDGKTNGVIFSMIQYGAYSTVEEMVRQLQKGGMYTKGSKYKNYEEYREDGNLDSYEEFGNIWNQNLSLHVTESDEITPEMFAASNKIFDFDKASFIRALSKPPVMETNYGSGVTSILSTIQDKYLEELYAQMTEIGDRFEAAEANNDKVAIREANNDFNALLDNIKVLTGKRPFVKIPKDHKNIASLAKTTIFGFGDTKRIEKAVEIIYKEPLANTLDTVYGGLRNSRETVTDVVELINARYIAMRNLLINKKIEENVAEGKSIKGTLHLTNAEIEAIEKDLEGMRPHAINSANTVLDENGNYKVEYAIDLAKETKAYGGSSFLIGTDGNISESKDTTFQIKTSFFEGKSDLTYNRGLSGYSSTGVAPGPINVHSLDAIAMYDAMLVNEKGLLVHDAKYFGFTEVAEGSQGLNKSFFDINVDNNIPMNAVTVLNRTLAEKNAIVAKYKLDNNTVNAVLSKSIEDSVKERFISKVNKVIREAEENGTNPMQDVNFGSFVYVNKKGDYAVNKKSITGTNIYKKYVKLLQDNANRVEALKKEVMDSMGHSDQYNFGESSTSWNVETKLTEENTIEEIAKEIKESAKAAIKEESVEDEALEIATQNKDPLDALRVSFKDSEKALNIINEINSDEATNFIKENKTSEENFVSLVKGYDFGNITDNKTKNIIKSIKGSKGKALKPNVKKALGITGEIQDNTIYGSANTIFDSVDSNDYDTQIDVDMSNVVDVFNKLPTTGKKETTSHLERLGTLVENMSNRLVTPFKMYMRDQGSTDSFGYNKGTDIYINNLRDGAPEISGILTKSVAMSTQEVMAHEMTHLIFKEGLKRDSQAKKAILRMYKAAKEQLDYTIFLEDANNPTQQEIENAQETFDYIFFNDDGKGLDEFAAFALTNEKFIEAFNTVKVKPSNLWSGTPYEILVKVFGYLVDLLSNTITKRKGLANDKQLEALMNDLLKVSGSKQGLVLQTIGTIANVPTQLVGLALTPVQILVNKLGSNLKERRESYLRLTGEVLEDSTYMFKIAEGATFMINSMRTALGDGRDTMLSSIYDELIGRNKNNAFISKYFRIKNQYVEGQSKSVKDSITKELSDGMKNKDLTERQKANLLAVLVKLDITTLIDSRDYTLEDVRDMLENDNILDGFINRVEEIVATFDNGQDYITQAKGLGMYLVDGKSRMANQMLNANNIAKGYYNPKLNISDDVANNVELYIDILASLHGIKNTDMVRRRSVANIITTEMDIESGVDGITNILGIHFSLKNASIEAFSNEAQFKTAYIKGYTKEDFRSDVGIAYGTLAQEEELLAQGYKRVSNKPLERDPSDPNYGDKDAELFMYKTPNGHLAKFTQGATSITNNTSKGTDLVQVNEQALQEDSWKTANQDVKTMQNVKGDKQVLNDNVNMVPVVSPSGVIVNYRYMMNENTKNTLLEKDNDIFRVMGSMAASTINKRETKKLNDFIVEDLKDNYDNDKFGIEEDYAVIGPESTNPKHREIYSMLPHEMKMKIREVWGRQGMLVRKENINALFGFRNVSLTDLFAKEPEARKWYQRIIVTALTKLLGKEAAHKIGVTEDWLKALVQEIKDIIVVKSGIVTVYNILSNTLSLMMNGLGIVDAMKLQWEAMSGSNAIRNDIAKKNRLEVRLNSATDPRRIKEIRSEIKELDRAIKENPIYLSFSQGLMPNIVDDIAADAALETTTRTKVQSKVSSVIDSTIGKVPYGSTIAKNALLLPDSETYGILNDLVIQSDFMARHALLSKKRSDYIKTHGHHPEGAALEEMVGQVEEIFINFNIPTHKYVQALNDLGFAWFTKYNIRVIKQIIAMFFRNPKRTAAVLIAGNITGVDIPDLSIIASLSGIPFVETLDNPLSQGVSSLGLIPALNML